MVTVQGNTAREEVLVTPVQSLEQEFVEAKPSYGQKPILDAMPSIMKNVGLASGVGRSYVNPKTAEMLTCEIVARLCRGALFTFRLVRTGLDPVPAIWRETVALHASLA